MARKIFVIILISIFPLFLMARMSRGEHDSEIIVSAAISLTNAFEEIGTLFKEKQKDVRILFNFGASGDLARQIIAGAPVDVFASASPKDMDDLDQKGLIIKGTRKDFAGNRVVLIIPAKSAIPLTSFNDLKREEFKRIAIGNPKTVPAGRYSEEVLIYFNLIGAVKDRLIFAENVRQVLDYVARGEVDAGMVYSTDALVRAKEVRIVAEAPEQSHRPVLYPIAVVKESKKEALAREFVSVVTSKEGKKVLEKYGFRVFNEGE
jgi:molybdate transport system substrate-binding protein